MKNILEKRIGNRGIGKYPAILCKSDESGFTLVEVLIAAVLIVSGLMMFVGTSASIMDRNVTNSNKAVAITLAQDKMEDIKHIARTISLAHGVVTPATSGSKINADYSAGTWSSLADEVLDAEGNASASGTTYTRTWDIDATASRTSMYDVTVVVTWNSGNRSATLKTQLSQ